jgi:hypothetical protein
MMDATGPPGDSDADAGNQGSQGATTPRGRKLTEHACESLARHGFAAPYSQVDDIMDNPTRVTKQADGATVYIQKAGKKGRRYNIVIEGDEGIVTGLRDLSKHELDNLGRNYGFDPNP